jgi:hypothetical protein
MTLEIHLILLEPADVELLARRATLELAGKVFLVVANDPVSSAAALAYMCPQQRYSGLPFPYLVIRPVVLTPSVRWVTKNMPASFMGW